MKKKTTKKLERRTFVGRVASISPIRPTKNGESEVQNVDIAVLTDGLKIYVEIAFWDAEGIALVRGLRLTEDLTKWEKFQDPIKVGTTLRVTGPYQMKKWSGKKLKNQKKPSVSVYNHTQIAVVRLPALPKA